MKVLVTGYNGQLGWDICRVLTERGIENRGVDIGDFDLTDANAVSAYLTDYAPDAVIHCAAYTAVDRAEEDAEKCRAVNVGGTANIARVCALIGAKMMYFSTDYVFGGTGDTFYEVDAPVNPRSVYGQTKFDGEQAVRAALPRHFILRTSWVFGINGKNFVRTMLRLAETHDVLTVVDDQIGSPTYTADLAELACDMIVTEQYGTYHTTNENICSWAEFAAAIMQEAGLSTIVKPITTAEFGAKAERPANSRLSKRSLDEAGFRRLPTWQDALHRYMEQLKQN